MSKTRANVNIYACKYILMNSRKAIVLSFVLIAAFSLIPVAAHSMNLKNGAMFKESFALKDGNVTESENWAGYAVTASNYSVSNVTASFIVPTVNTGGNSYAAFWVGIDGFNDGTVEQTGIIAEPTGHGPHSSTEYLVWYEFYPAAPVYASFTAAPGDIVYATVSYNAGYFTTCISVISSSGHVGTFSHSQTVSGAQDDSAEWIVEAPASAGEILPLADFGTAYFGENYTGIQNTNYATISGTHASIGSFTTATEIIMVSSSGVPEATPSALNSNGTSFYVTYDQSSTSTHGHGHH